MTDVAPPDYNPGREFLAAVPDLARIADELNVVLKPAMLAGHPGSRGMAEAGWMIAKALRFLAAAAQASDVPGQDEALDETDTDLLAAAGHVHAVRAAANPIEKLAAAGEAARESELDLCGCIATRATIRVLQADPSEDLAPDEVQADLDALGRIRWTSARYGQLPIDGRTQLDLAAALDGIAAAYARTAHGATS